MAATGDETNEHQLLVLSRRIKAALAAQADTQLWSMTEDETTEFVTNMAAIAAQVAEGEARGIAHAEELELPAKAGVAGKRGIARWVAMTTHVTGPVAGQKVKLARAGAVGEATRAALANGDVHVEQAHAITTMLGKLKRAEAETDLVLAGGDLERAEAFLLTEAADQDAEFLTTLTQRLIETIDPAGAEAHEAKALEAAENRATAKASLKGRRIGDGMIRGSFVLPEAHWDMLKKPLHGLAAPKHVRAKDGAGAYDYQTPSAHKLGRAFMEYLERFPATNLPKLGGQSSTVVAVGDHDILLGKVKAARLDTGTKISHTLYIRLAAQNGIIPAWMDSTTGKPRVLDLGRRKRFHSPDQRLAKTVQGTLDPDNPHGPTCETPGCTVPAYLTHLHHGRRSWADGGHTNLVDAQFQCPYDHHRLHAHDPKTRTSDRDDHPP